MKPTTARVYTNIFQKFAHEHGHRLVAQMQRKHVEAIISKMLSRPGAANSWLKRFRTLMSYAIVHGWRKDDPSFKIKSFKAGEIHTWTEEQISFFRAHWKIGTRARLAFELALYSGQRRGDLSKMKWSDYDGETINVVQQKTGAKLEIPVHQTLKKILDDADRRGETILVNEYSRPFASPAAFGNFFADCVRAVSILPRECSLHGLRKAAARRLAEAGCTTHEVASITGHASLSEVQRYTRHAEQKRLAQTAIAKQSRHRAGKP